MLIKCKTCKKETKARADEVKSGRKKYCSSECQHEGLKNGVIKICEYCGDDFYVNQSTLKTKKCRFCSIECHSRFKKENKQFSGDKNPRWKGGITKENNKIRHSDEYIQWRKDVFERDGYQCVWCGAKGSTGAYLHADHIKPFAFFPELRFEISNGRTLCRDCHKYTATYLGRYKKYFGLNQKKFIPKKSRIEYGGMIMGPEEFDAVFQTILSSGGKRWTIGPESEMFEKELAEKVGVERAVVVNSGSSALLVALSSLKLPKGSLVAIPAVNFPTAFNAILQNGYIPHVVDVDLKTLNMDLEKLKLAKGLKAVVAVNIASNPNDLVAIRKIVGDEVKIVLDNCDGISTMINEKYVEHYADISCTSFHAAHIIGMGEGGAILTNDHKLADICKKLREWGRASGTDAIYDYPGFPDDYRERYVYEEIGWNMKPLELQCAIGRIQLKRMDGFRKRRLENYARMRAVFEKYPQFTLMESMPNATVCWFSFPLLCTGIKRKLVMDTLEENNIECRTIFSGNILRHPAYKNTPYSSEGEMTNADIVMRDGMFLSVHPSITPEMIAFIDEVIGKLCA